MSIRLNCQLPVLSLTVLTLRVVWPGASRNHNYMNKISIIMLNIVNLGVARITISWLSGLWIHLLIPSRSQSHFDDLILVKAWRFDQVLALGHPKVAKCTLEGAILFCLGLVKNTLSYGTLFLPSHHYAKNKQTSVHISSAVSLNSYISL